MEKFGKLMAMRTYEDLCGRVNNTQKAQRYVKNIVQKGDSFVKSSCCKSPKNILKKLFK